MDQIQTNSGAILKINTDGSPASGNPFQDSGNEILQRYTAYGVRNSFGLTIDPVTGALWDTENGEDLMTKSILCSPASTVDGS